MGMRLLLSVFLVFLALQKAETYDEKIVNHLLAKLEPGSLLCNCSAQTGCGVRLNDNTVLKGVCHTKGGCMTSIARNQRDFNEIVHSYTCVEERNYHPRERPLVCNIAKTDAPWRNYFCCHDKSFCASDVNITLEDIPEALLPKEKQSPSWMLPVILGSSLLLLIAAVVIVSFYCITKCHMFPAVFPSAKKPLLSHEVALPDKADIEPIRPLLGALDTESGTGQGDPLMETRTISREITLGEQIGEGRYGKVYMGNWKGEKVAVKIFFTRDEASYYRERDIFTTYMLRDNNILPYVASDNIDRFGMMELWIITEYQQNGSLFDYLSHNTLSPRQLCIMARSVASGLVYLHRQVTTDHGTKPAIAHRDLKTKNVLVKANGECAIGDYGLALRDKTYDLVDPNIKSGTKRYQPPEVLDGTLNTNLFEDYLRGDIYCLGLILWEMARRVNSTGIEAEEYELPYFEHVPSDPSEEDMRQCVCVNGHRPRIPRSWATDPILNRMSVVMKECWTRNQDARLPALKVKKDLQTLEDTFKPLPRVTA